MNHRLAIAQRNFFQKLFSRDVHHLWDLVIQLVSRELKLRYKRSVLGIAWTLLNPLLQLLVFATVFRGVLQLNIPHYASSVFCGLMVWNWFQSSLTDGTGVINANPTLIRQPGFPSIILPIVVILVHMVHFLLALPVLVIFLLIDGVMLQTTLWQLPLLMLLQLGFTAGLSYILAATNVMFHDTRYTVGVLLQLLFYATPIFYDLSHIPVRYQFWYQLNPIAHLVTAYRGILIQGVPPNWFPLLGVGVVAIGLFMVGRTYFMVQSDRFVEEL
ncbi:ABC transporter permease [Merismopedia glauca]|uniref:Transport permease protein n=1 Tax=Merismopedia glauca CCAP 1448/3 TaxID=1296344 RepID=A0A2T1C099_9CYAN|nr:ABC transporter permease [Merismopedia glauca]PSB01597.1 ABC transporter [Merismopedia glauca CCAP 1448/3]